MRALILVSRDVIDDARAIRQAGTLLAAGHDVRILCWDREAAYPVEDALEGVAIQRIRSTGLMRAAPGDAAKNPFWWRRAYDEARVWKPDVVVAHDLDALPPAVRLKKRTGCKVVYDSCELFYHMIVDKVPRIISQAALRLERRLVPHVDHVLIVDDPYQSYFVNEVPYDGPITKVMNCTWPRPTGRWPALPKGPLTLFYAGSLTADRMVVELAQAGRAFPDIRVVLAGGGVLEDEVAALARELPNVEFLGTIAFTEVVERMRQAHVIPALTDPSNANVRNATSLKQFEAMVAGRAIIAAQGCLTAEIALETESGLAVPFTQEALHAAIAQFLEDPGLASRLGKAAFATAKNRFNWNIEGQAFLEAVESACAS